MPIRITGMYSGLDTEAIISELASAQSMKKNSLVKKQISLSWKMDAWKALNTKIYSFYSKTLDNMRFQSSYFLKTTKVSSSSISVSTKNNAVNGVQNLEIVKMAKMGYLTGGKISVGESGKVSASTKLSELGIEEGGSFSVEAGGKSVKINVTADTTISNVVSQLQSAGLNASFDEKNQRFFVSSKKSGEEYNFHLVGDSAAGMDILSKLGLLTETDMKSGVYDIWAGYIDDSKTGEGEDKYTSAYYEALEKEIEARAASYKKANNSLAAENEKLEKANDELKEKIAALKDDPGYNKDMDADALYDLLYGKEEDVTDEDGNQSKVRNGGLKADLDKAKADYENALAEGKTGDELQSLKDAYDNAQSDFNKANGEYSIAKAIKDTQASIDANDAKITANEEQIEKNQKYYDEETGEATEALRTEVKDEFDIKIQNAKNVINGTGGFTASKGATKIEGQDAEITLNGATFTSESNTFDINGLEITVLEENIGEKITLSTGEDIDGIYDMVKNFLTEYNKLINEMDALYNADSSKGYDPLLTEEKDGLSDSEIEEWEKKIKDSILRRDQTLSDVIGTLSNTLLAGTEVNGVQMYLSQFGINTLGYFNAADNEKHAYHIDGDPDDANTMSKDDVLRSMIASDPETVMNFFSQLSKNLYDNLGKQMAGTTASSAFTVYNDKTMKEEYDAYTEKIAKQEAKLNSLMERWYSKFSKMETAMSKLESKNSALASMLGG